MTDPRDFDRRMDMERRMEMERRMVPTASPMWGWIAGGAFILVVLALIFSAGEGSKTASTQPPSTTGQGTR